MAQTRRRRDEQRATELVHEIVEKGLVPDDVTALLQDGKPYEAIRLILTARE
jgi:hypothetical protein